MSYTRRSVGKKKPSFLSWALLSPVDKLVEHAHRQDHNKQAYSDDDEERKTEPAEDHSRCADAGPDGPVSEILRYNGGADRGGVLPEHRDEDEDGGDEDDGEGHLRDGPRGKGFHFAFGAFRGFFLVPAWEGGEEEEADEGEDDGDDAVTRSLVSLWFFLSV